MFFTKEEIEKARSIDLLTYLRSYEPEDLVHLYANVYCTRQHDSLKISNGKWMWWSKGFGGTSALDYLIKVKGLDFKSAVSILTGKSAPKSTPYIPSKNKIKFRKLLLPEKNDECSHITEYLLSRGISEKVIKSFIKRNILYESLPNHACIFVGTDASNIPRYAAFRACTEEKILGEASGSDKSYPFRIEAPASPTLHLFECAIDLMSYATLLEMNGYDFDKENLLSMGGINVSKCDTLPVAIRRYLEENTHIKEIHIHFDRDCPGISAAKSLEKKLENKYLVINAPPPFGKDFNQYLMAIVKEKDSTSRIF